MRSAPLTSAVALAALLAAPPAHAVESYTECLRAIDTNPDQAFDAAGAWADMGGGAAARHCQALALLKLGHYGEAAVRLEAVAREPAAGEDLDRAEILGQAGNAWLLQHEAQKAYNALSRALSLKPDDRELLIDRARASALGEDFKGAQEDLTTILMRTPGDIEALILRADARQALGDLAGARMDAEAAVKRAPRSADAWLQRGIVRHFQGDAAGALNDWRMALKVDPDSPAAATAQSYLQESALGQNPGGTPTAP